MLRNQYSYLSLLQNPKWLCKRKEILDRDNYHCIACKATANLQVHHRQYHFNRSKGHYLKPWQYKGKYLTTLCQLCHDKGHKIYKIPTKYI